MRASSPNMIRIAGGIYRMGSDRHYAEEAPSHRVTVDPFWIDATPVTNAQFRAFVQATGYVTWAEIDPDPKDYPGAKPNMLKAGGLVFTPPKKAIDDSTTTKSAKKALVVVTSPLFSSTRRSFLKISQVCRAKEVSAMRAAA